MTGQLSALAQGKAAGTTGYTSKLLKTGQTTQYDSELDDGYYEVGVAKSYTVNTAGAQSGTTNVDLAHYAGAAGAIAFNNSTKKITDSGNGLALFKTNDVILTNSASNPGPFTVTTGNVAGEITCTGATFTDETPAGAVTLYKREAVSNNTVLDNNTGLTWMRYWSVKMGPASTGTLAWSGQLYDIFAWCAACNAVSVGGHNDWRVPNVFEMHYLVDHNRASSSATNWVDATAFPTQKSDNWTSTRDPYNGETRRMAVNIQGATVNNAANYATTYKYVLLVRGGTA